LQFLHFDFCRLLSCKLEVLQISLP
jgi:hypothetical protein